MSAKWFYRNGDQVLGPISASTLKQIAMRGQIGPKTLVRRDEDGAWHPASKVKGLIDGPAKNSEANSPAMKLKEINSSAPEEEIIEVEVVDSNDNVEEGDEFDSDFFNVDSSYDSESLGQNLPALPRRQKTNKATHKPVKKKNSTAVHPLAWIGLSCLGTLVISVPMTLVVSGFFRDLAPAPVNLEEPPPVVNLAAAPPEPLNEIPTEKLLNPTQEELAKKILKSGLDAWVFGDSHKKFQSDNPQCVFTDFDWVSGKMLLRYEMGPSRKVEKTDVIEFSVIIVQTTNSGQEVKKNKKYTVLPTADGTWLVTGL